jgi:hypothetical protein
LDSTPSRGRGRRFAETASLHATEHARVLVQDDHLQLVPGMLRELRPDLRIGFFLRIPFPPTELFAQLPGRRRILEGLLGVDRLDYTEGIEQRLLAEAPLSAEHWRGSSTRPSASRPRIVTCRAMFRASNTSCGIAAARRDGARHRECLLSPAPSDSGKSVLVSAEPW